MAASALATSLLTVCPVVGDLPTLFGSDNTTTHPTPQGARWPSSEAASINNGARTALEALLAAVVPAAPAAVGRESVDSAVTSCCGASSCTECDASAAVREMAVCVEDAAEDEDDSVLLLAQGNALIGTGVDAPGDGFMVFDTSMRQIQTCDSPRDADSRTRSRRTEQSRTMRPADSR
ncbi:hypothetical protein ACCO45_005737 [Purpureocillium lilacinum]|uniref:Uncharacterized protein n=1 Tax=Purpureocillium lilacinum TaxID=33203 RepID=A0ACC4DZ68_PURLI